MWFSNVTLNSMTSSIYHISYRRSINMLPTLPVWDYLMDLDKPLPFQTRPFTEDCWFFFFNVLLHNPAPPLLLSLSSHLPALSVSPHSWLSVPPPPQCRCFLLLKPLTGMVFGAELIQPCLVAAGHLSSKTQQPTPSRPAPVCLAKWN